MTLYNPIKDTSPTPPVLANDPTNYVMGLVFTVSAACNITGIWHWVDSAQFLGPEDFALWTITGPGPVGAYVTGSKVTGTGFTAGAWNLVLFTTPIALTAGVEYMAARTSHGTGVSPTNSGYSSAQPWFSSGSPGGAGFVAGPATVYSSNTTGFVGSANIEPTGSGQQLFNSQNAGPVDVTVNMPNQSFHASWYGMDVQIQTGAAPPAPSLLMASFP
jgi:hypothetical protein